MSNFRRKMLKTLRYYEEEELKKHIDCEIYRDAAHNLYIKNKELINENEKLIKENEKLIKEYESLKNVNEKKILEEINKD